MDFLKKMAQALKNYSSDPSVMDGYQPPAPSVDPRTVSGVDAIGPPTIGPLSLDPTDYFGPNTLKTAGAGLAKMAAALSGKAAAATPLLGAMTAWHGSPHKFDKFSLDKIGTGEGAQAYGHGLYLAESPEVARSYAEPASKGWDKDVFYKGQPLTASTPYEKTALDYFQTSTPMPSAPKRVQEAIATLESQVKLFDRLKSPSDSSNAKMAIEYLRGLDPSMIEVATKKSNLYKTDIPDEAVARFLDWDKPLSQQAPEVQKAMSQVIAKKNPRLAQYLQESAGLDEAGQTAVRKRLGLNIFDTLDTGGAAYQAAGQGGIENSLRSMGVPGIRYLDGGSRSAGQGSSNFVAFDPEMIRILERNGQATGSAPWKPGEWPPKK